MSHHEVEDDAISDIEGSSLFSDGDSEIIDSPADGYFSQRSHPQQFYVQNEAPSKAQEASRSPVSPQEYAPSSSQPPAWGSEQTPLLDAGPAPPDYYAATADRRASGGHGEENDYRVRSYGSIRDEERADGRPRHTPRVLLQAGLFGGERVPQSMSSSAYNHDEEDQTILVKHPVQRKGWRQWTRTRGKRGLTVLLAVLAIVIIIVLGLSDSGGEYNQDPYPSNPGTTPTPTQPGDDSSNPHYPHDTLPTHSALPGCSYSTFSQFWHYDFNDISNFTFEEDLHLSNYAYSGGGNIWIRLAPDEQIPDVRVSISFVTSSSLQVIDPRPLLTRDSIKLGMPEIRTVETTSSYLPCIDAGIAIDVKQGFNVDHWLTQTKAFNIFVPASLFDKNDDEDSSDWLGIGDTSTLSTVSGKIDASYWSSRRTVISTTAGSVHGEYALRDLLAITTRSGAISVKVDPKEADEEKPVPAVFTAKTEAGSVNADFPNDDLPQRDYETRVQTSVGSISGNYIHGTKSDYQTNAGSITATILPFNTSDSSTLTTTTTHGSTTLRILSPYDDGPLKNMVSKHDSSKGSASIVLHYPDEWEGYFTATSRTGSLIVRGDGIKTDWVFDLFGLFGKKVAGHKGIGDSEIDIRTNTGSVVLNIGSKY